LHDHFVDEVCELLFGLNGIEFDAAVELLLDGLRRTATTG